MREPVALIAFTDRGASLCARLAEALGGRGYAPGRWADCHRLIPLEEPVAAWAASRFAAGEAMVFVCAAGIAVRAVGPLLRSKDRDPAVVCVDELGQYAIPLASGHLGGANDLARRIAALIGGEAVITTATDLEGCFSPDQWAARNSCRVADKGMIKAVAAALLQGEPVGWYSEFPVVGPLPRGLVTGDTPDYGVVVSLRKNPVFRHTLWLVPRCISVGVGCRRGVAAAAVESAVLGALEDLALTVQSLAELASIDLKAGEAALLSFAAQYGVPLRTYSAGVLEAVEGSRSASAFVAEITGVDNVCERAALAGGGRLLLEKRVAQGVTVAVAQREWSGRF